MRAALLITAKDLRQRLRDRSALLIALVAPLSFALVLSLTISGVSGGSERFRLGLVDRDQGPAAKAFTKTVAGSRGVVRLRRVETVDKGRSLANAGTVAATIVLPRGLSAATMGARSVRIEVLGDPDQAIGTLVARAFADSFSNQLKTIRLASLALDKKPAETVRIAAEVATARRPVAIKDTTTERKNLEPKTYYAAAMSVFFLFFAVQFGISSLLDERREGTLARMLVAPIPRRSILGGKILSSLAIGVTSMIVLAVATRYGIGAYWGNPLGVAILIISAVLAATGVVAFVITLAKTQEQANAWLAVVSVVLGILGGSFFPVAQVGGLIAVLSRATPHAWFLSGLQDLSTGAPVSEIAVPVLVLCSIAGVCGVAALVRIRRLIEP